MIHKTKKTKIHNPIIEIFGLPHTGKKLISRTVAHNLGFNYLYLPDFRQDSYTGKVLYKYLGDPMLDNNKAWWSLISAANFYENWHLIEGPIVVCNYKTAFKALFKKDRILQSIPEAKKLIELLPEPDLVFCLLGDEFISPNSLPALPPVSNYSYCANLHRLKDSRIVNVYNNGELKSKKRDSTTFTNVATFIEDYIIDKYNVIRLFDTSVPVDIINTKCTKRNIR